MRGPQPAPCQAKEVFGTSLPWTPASPTTKFYPQNTTALQGCVELWPLKPSTSQTTNRLRGPEPPRAAFADCTGLLDWACHVTQANGHGGVGQPPHRVLPWKALGRGIQRQDQHCQDMWEDTATGRASPPGEGYISRLCLLVANACKPFCSWQLMFWESARTLPASSRQLGRSVQFLRERRGSGRGLGGRGGTSASGSPARPGCASLKSRNQSSHHVPSPPRRAPPGPGCEPGKITTALRAPGSVRTGKGGGGRGVSSGGRG